jgi:hypothetical protein
MSYGLGRRRRSGRRWRPRTRAGGCLLWILVVIIVLIVLSLLFGGFQKGTKAGGLGAPPRVPAAAAPAGTVPAAGVSATAFAAAQGGGR